MSECHSIEGYNFTAPSASSGRCVGFRSSAGLSAIAQDSLRQHCSTLRVSEFRDNRSSLAGLATSLSRRDEVFPTAPGLERVRVLLTRVVRARTNRGSTLFALLETAGSFLSLACLSHESRDAPTGSRPLLRSGLYLNGGASTTTSSTHRLSRCVGRAPSSGKKKGTEKERGAE